MICSFSNAGVNGLVNSGCCGNDDENWGPGLLKPPLSGDDGNGNDPEDCCLRNEGTDDETRGLPGL